MAALKNQLLLWPSSLDPGYLTFQAFLEWKILSCSEKWRLRNVGDFCWFSRSKSLLSWMIRFEIPQHSYWFMSIHPFEIHDVQNQPSTNRNDFLNVVYVHSLNRMPSIFSGHVSQNLFDLILIACWITFHKSQVVKNGKKSAQENCEVLDTTWLAFQRSKQSIENGKIEFSWFTMCYINSE